jgi:predicted Rossmann-fold nucleotide-binding protein
MTEAYERISMAGIAAKVPCSLAEAIETGRELEEMGLGVVSGCGNSFMFTPAGLDKAQQQVIRQQMDGTRRSER